MIWWGSATGAGFNESEIKLGMLDPKAGETTISVKFIMPLSPGRGVGGGVRFIEFRFRHVDNFRKICYNVSI